jgi:sorbitol-specific phosphotransferase system component IIBC
LNGFAAKPSNDIATDNAAIFCRGIWPHLEHNDTTRQAHFRHHRILSGFKYKAEQSSLPLTVCRCDGGTLVGIKPSDRHIETAIFAVSPDEHLDRRLRRDQPYNMGKICRVIDGLSREL